MENNEEIKPESLRPASEVIQAFLRARKNLRMYPPNNPIYIRTVKDTCGRFEEFFDYEDTLKMKITRNEILIDSEPVYQSTGKDENLALFLFRDGLRELSFEKGIKENEIQEFLEIISVDFDREDIEDDIVTLLWAREFQNIKYAMDDTFLTEDENYQEEAVTQVKEDVCTDDNLKQAYEEAARSSEDQEVEFLPITDSDMKALVHMIEKDHESKSRKLINILIDMLRQSRELEEFRDIGHIMSNAIDYFMQNRDLKNTVEVVKKARIFVDEAPSQEIKKCLNVVLAHAVSHEVISKVGDILDSSDRLDDQVFNEFQVLLGAGVIGPFVSLLGEMRTVSGKKRVITALARIGRHDVATLSKGLRDDRPLVVRSIVQVLRGIKDNKATEFLIKAVNHKDPGVRKDMIVAIGELGGQGAEETVKDFLDDPSESIRTTAAKALATIGSEHARKILMDRVSDKKFQQAGFDEMKDYFEAIARLKDDAVAKMMMEILKRRAFFKRAKHFELKACAVHCLGLMRSTESLGEIKELRKSSNKLLSDYARAAVKRIEHGK
jgi:hypothetical protein